MKKGGRRPPFKRPGKHPTTREAKNDDARLGGQWFLRWPQATFQKDQANTQQQDKPKMIMQGVVGSCFLEKVAEGHFS